jgi:glycerate kinase
MRVLLAFDKFKDALTAPAVCDTAAHALAARHPAWEFDRCPLTDGGEGFGDILTHAAGGRSETVRVAGPRGEPVTAAIGYVSLEDIPSSARQRLQIENNRSETKNQLAVIEMAAVSGLALLPPPQRDPWQTTTLGTGQLIRAAADRGVAAILLGIGGSATNDLGLGALAALGLEFRAADGAPVSPPIPAAWDRIARIAGRARMPLPPISIACDVSNPLLGPQGCTAVYGPQKGLRPADYSRLEAAVARLARMLCDHCGRPPELVATPGTGAAGGISFGLMAAAGARLVPGFDLVSDWLDLSRRIAAADLVLTGEGRFDASSLSGKGPGSIVAAARRTGKAVHVFAGALGGLAADDSFHAITPAGLPLAEALPRTAELLAAAVTRHL